ncbi:MAG: SPOR domain-containing protein [Gammaproteobacteria bacterium]|nr:SPOR domain-containing protein [Gammaproteobacteria bacterium]MDE0364016.1 SPOR domain-containing protein [Gammaproteobacteria bacterium]
MNRRSSKKRRGLHGPSFLGGGILGAGAVAVALLVPGFVSEQFARLPDVTPGQDDLEVVFEFPELLREPVPVDPESYGTPGSRRNDEPPSSGPEAAPSAAGEGQPAPAQPAPVRITEIYIQAASFRDAGDADQLRARLLLQGLPASLGQVELGDGTWHRVTVGPIDSAERAGSIMARLRDQNLSPMRINPG